MQRYSIKKCLEIPGYKIREIIKETKKEIHIRIEPYKRKRFLCSGCGKIHKKGYHGEEESIVEDLKMFKKRVYLHVIKRRYKCPEDNRIYIEEISWVKKWGRVTKRYGEEIS